MSDGTMPGRDAVEQWLNGVRGELERVAIAIEPLLAEQTRLREREALLMKLLRSVEDSAAVSSDAVATQPPEATPAPRAHTEGSVLEYVRSGVLEVLREKGGAMHINDIHAKFVGKGYRVPGAGRPANLTAHLARAEGIVSPTRGFYAVAAEDAATKQQEPRRRKKS